MSRDRPDAADPPRAGAPEVERGERGERDDRRAREAPELLTAYVDGVAELSTDERRQIEARLADDPGARADEAQLRDLLRRLRDLPPEGTAPDWSAMERSIRAAVGSEVPRPWWRAWRWLVPLTSCATAAAVMLLLWSRPGAIREPALPAPPAERGVARPAPPPTERGDDAAAIVPLWLDGAEVDVDLSAAEILRGPEIGESDPSQPDADADAYDDRAALLPAGDLGWVDRLDDAAIARAERWLASGSSAPAGSGDGALPRKKS